MTNTHLRYTEHALFRMDERNISRRDVDFILKYGTREAGHPSPDGHARWAKRELIHQPAREAKVVYVEDPGWITVITVMWVTEETK